MYKKVAFHRTTINRNDSKEGETIEMKMRRILQNKEPIKDGAPEIFTERKEGVVAAYNIRTDRFDLALDATDAITKSQLAKRDGKGITPEGGDETKVIDLKEGQNKGTDNAGKEST